MTFDNSSDVQIIAEIGLNHEGSEQRAIKIMNLASEAGVKIVKFQSYNTNRYTAIDNGERFHRLNRYSLSLEAIKRLKLEADKLGLTLLSTPLTEDWVEPLSNICPILKIASGDINFTPILEKAAKSKKPIILSTGAANIEEIDKAVTLISNFVGNSKLFDKLTLMHCISAYPTPIEQANILSIPYLKSRYGLKVGFSNHVLGFGACLAAVANGADLLEIHFTDKKNSEFRDHQLSFDKVDMISFINLARQVKLSLGTLIKIHSNVNYKT